ncbi:hypothetical protein HY627_02435 [Candidatus Uhrbacteria bacterium]|nr:hypothetical protein [Candidatus Uhrbacteria bacterium]
MNLYEKKPQGTILREILSEVRSLKRQVEYFLPSERFGEYAHPVRIKKSLKKALRQYSRMV